MSNYIATVIKTGNSYALRLPKEYFVQSKLILGQKVQVGKPIIVPKEHNPKAIKQAIRNLQEVGAFHGINDPVAWQRKIRQDRSLPGRN